MEHGGKRIGAGRPQGSKATHTLEAEAVRQHLIQETIKNKEAIVAALIKQAKDGKVPAIKELLERVLGRPSDLIELMGRRDNQQFEEDTLKLKNLLKSFVVMSREQRAEFQKKFGRDPLANEPYSEMI